MLKIYFQTNMFSLEYDVLKLQSQRVLDVKQLFKRSSNCGILHLYHILIFYYLIFVHFGYTCFQVSPTYSKEVAGNPAIAPHLYKFHGIINGIDPDIWDPYNDNFIPVSWYMTKSFIIFS